MKSSKPKISIIIPAYNEEKYIEDCIKSVLNQDISRSDYEVIIVDNASTDKTAQIAKKFPVKVVSEPKKGNVYARIRGLKMARAELIATTDADCRAPINWLSKMSSHFKKDPAVVAVGGVFEFYDGSNFLKFFAKSTQKMTYHISGGCTMVKKSALNKVGGYDPTVSLGEDVLLHFKLNKVGKVIIDYSVIVQTSARRFENNLPKTLFMYTNDITIRLFGKPLFKKFDDIR